MTCRCSGCNKFLGVIEAGNLYKKIVFLCDNCDTKRRSAILAMEMKTKENPFGDLFGDIFGKGK